MKGVTSLQVCGYSFIVMHKFVDSGKVFFVVYCTESIEIQKMSALVQVAKEFFFWAASLANYFSVK